MKSAASDTAIDIGANTGLNASSNTGSVSSICLAHLFNDWYMNSGALGGLVGGHLSDLFGRKVVIVSSLTVSSPLLYLFLSTSGPLSYMFLALAGAALLASFSVTIVVAQEIVYRNAAMAAGLMLGFGIGIGGLGVGLMGLLVEQMGIRYAIHLIVWTPLLAGLLALAIKDRRTQAALSDDSRGTARP